MLFVKPERSVDPLTLVVMREVDKLVNELKLIYFVCGVTARDILLKHVHCIEIGIAIEDVDFGVAVENWEQFENIKVWLIKTGRFESAKKMAQCLYYKSNAKSGGYPIDIIPFGGVEQPLKLIAWSPDMDEVMNVVGYQEVLANILEIQVEDGFVVLIISLSGLAILKLFVWADRGAQNSKDARDLLLLFR